MTVNLQDIEKAERVLQVSYGDQNIPRQLQSLEVNREAFDAWINHRKESAFKHYFKAYKDTDPRIEAAFNTLLMHFFLVGLVCGRGEVAVIE